MADRWDRKPRWKPLDYMVAGVLVAVLLGAGYLAYLVCWFWLGGGW